jgi:hypothetical protein
VIVADDVKGKLQAIAEAPGVINPLRINEWVEVEGEPVNKPGRLVSVAAHRADGQKELPRK